MNRIINDDDVYMALKKIIKSIDCWRAAAIRPLHHTFISPCSHWREGTEFSLKTTGSPTIMPCSQVRPRQVMRDGQPQTVSDIQSGHLPSKLHPQTLTCTVHTGDDVLKPQSLLATLPTTSSIPQTKPFLHLAPVCPCMHLSQWVLLWHNF